MVLPVKRQDTVNWQAKSTEYYLKPVYQLLKEKLLEQPITCIIITRIAAAE